MLPALWDFSLAISSAECHSGYCKIRDWQDSRRCCVRRQPPSSPLGNLKPTWTNGRHEMVCADRCAPLRSLLQDISQLGGTTLQSKSKNSLHDSLNRSLPAAFVLLSPSQLLPLSATAAAEGDWKLEHAEAATLAAREPTIPLVKRTVRCNKNAANCSDRVLLLLLRVSTRTTLSMFTSALMKPARLSPGSLFLNLHSPPFR